MTSASTEAARVSKAPETARKRVIMIALWCRHAAATRAPRAAATRAPRAAPASSETIGN